MRASYVKSWATVYRTTLVNLVLLFGGDLAVRYRLLPDVWQLHGIGLVLTGAFIAWTAAFVWLLANPIAAELWMVLKERIDRINYVFLFGMIIVSVSYYALIYFLVLRLDPTSIKLTSDTARAADLLYFSTLTFLNQGYGVMSATGWFPRLAMLTETIMGLGYLAGVVALLTNRLTDSPDDEEGGP